MTIPPVLSALAGPTRRAATRILWDGAERCLCEMMERCGSRQSRMSRQMARLRAAGRYVGRRDAQWVRHRLRPDLSAPIRAVLAAVMACETADPRKIA